MQKIHSDFCNIECNSVIKKISEEKLKILKH